MTADELNELKIKAYDLLQQFANHQQASAQLQQEITALQQRILTEEAKPRD